MTYTVFQALIKTQHSVVIKYFRCDLNEKYTFNKFYKLFALDEIIYQTLKSIKRLSILPLVTCKFIKDYIDFL